MHRWKMAYTATVWFRAVSGMTFPELFWPYPLFVFIAFPVFYSFACVNRHGVFRGSNGKSQAAPDQQR